MKITVSLLIKFLSIMHLNSASDNRIKIFTVTRQAPDIIKITVFQSISWQVNWNKHFLMKGFCFAKLPLSTTKMSHNIERPCGVFLWNLSFQFLLIQLYKKQTLSKWQFSHISRLVSEMMTCTKAACIAVSGCEGFWDIVTLYNTTWQWVKCKNGLVLQS